VARTSRSYDKTHEHGGGPIFCGGTWALWAPLNPALDCDIRYVFVGCAEKLLKLKVIVRLLAEICLPQKLSARHEHALHFVQNL